MPQSPPDAAIGVTLIGLFKCEDEACGALFIRAVDFYYPAPSPMPDPAVDMVFVKGPAVVITCPHGHKAKFVQTVERTLIYPPPTSP